MSAASAPPIPAPRLQQVRNATPFPHLQFDKMGKGRRFYDVVIVCASFILEAGRLQPAAGHRGPVLADEFWDPARAELSSLRAATDVLLVKPATDVYVTGAARTFDRRACKAWNVALTVKRRGELLLHKTLRLTGPRRWTAGPEPGHHALSDAEPTREVQLRYELAYGGWWFDKGDGPSASPRTYGQNPCGTGWFGTAAKKDDSRARYEDSKTVPAPQIEYADAPIPDSNQDLLVAGLAPIARSWEPRVALAGTYDDAWRKRFEHETAMDYASDFDERFFQYAPGDQVIAGGLVGDEEIHLAGFFASAPAIDMQLPHVRIEATCEAENGERHREAMKLDTVHIDLDDIRVHLTWRLTLDQTRNIVAVELRDQSTLDNAVRAEDLIEGVSS